MNKFPSNSQHSNRKENSSRLSSHHKFRFFTQSLSRIERAKKNAHIGEDIGERRGKIAQLVEFSTQKRWTDEKRKWKCAKLEMGKKVKRVEMKSEKKWGKNSSIHSWKSFSFFPSCKFPDKFSFPFIVFVCCHYLTWKLFTASIRESAFIRPRNFISENVRLHLNKSPRVGCSFTPLLPLN